VAQEPSIGIAQEKTKLRLRIANALTLLHAFYRGLTWERAKAVVNGALSNISKLLWIVLVVVIVIFVAQDLSNDLVAIEPISVPKVLSESGYTSEVASRRLRDAIDAYAAKTGSRMRHPNVAPRGELPDIVVPKIGLSLETIVSSIRGLSHFGSRQTVSGEFVVSGKLAWLRLRVDGKEVHSSPNGLDLENPDELFVEAAPAVVEKIRPYLVASALYQTDPKKGVQKADEIIARLPESDVNVHWSYVLRGIFFGNKKDYAKSEEAFRKAISLDRRNFAAHYNYGLLLYLRGSFGDAVREYRRAIEIDPKNVDAHINYGVILSFQSKFSAAAAEFQRAIAIEPRAAEVHNLYGVFLANQDELDQAIAEYQIAIEIDPKNPQPHFNLALALGRKGNHDDEIAEYRFAITLNPKHAAAHNNLGVVLRDQGKLDDAINEFHLAVKADPDSTEAKDNFEGAWRKKASPPSE
jgi:Tfp pilus assembly protein PilF